MFSSCRWSCPLLFAVIPFAVTAQGAEPPAAGPTASASSSAQAGAIPVRVVRSEDGKYQLERGGKPYFIQGAGGDGSRKLLAAAGANSLRTWGTEGLDKVLDEAQKNGLTVAVGIWLGHERHGFNYNDADMVAGQVEEVRKTIERYKNHPAILLWSLGNEMEGYAQGDNAAIWSAINSLAVLAKRIDPNHPTMTVVAEIGGQRVKNIHRLCPEIDLVGINSYGGIASLPARYKEAGGTKPYIVTEFGPPGSWETKKTSWNVAPELTSTEKAERYRIAWEKGVRAAEGTCLGGYAFVWGHKQEATATWFGMLLPRETEPGGHRKLGAVDALTELWSGKPPANRCPLIEKLALAGADQVEPGASLRFDLSASDPDGDALEITWVLRGEPAWYAVGG